MSNVEKWWPRRGPCAFCEGYDQVHRVVDSIAEQVRAGEDSPEALALDYGVSVEAILAAAAASPDHYKL